MQPDITAALAASPWAKSSGLSWQPGVAAVASPMCQAVDSMNAIVTKDGSGDALFLKLLQPDMAGWVDFAAAYAGSVAGMQAGVAPEVVFCLPEHSALGFTYYPEPWRGARLDDLRRSEVLAAVIAAKAALRRGPALPRQWDVFEQIHAYAARARAARVALPPDMPALLAQVDTIHDALTAAGRDSLPCHNDGQSSNILLGPGGRVLLVDFDCAGQADPHYDLAVILNEAHDFEDGWRAGVEMQEGRCDQRVLDRCHAYAVADDVLWGLWGHTLSATSPRHGVEFLKLGEWRLLRARMALRAPGFAERLHRL